MVRKNIFSIIVALIILFLSLTGSDTFDKVPLFNIPYLDKIVHFLMYSGFMSVIILENRNRLAGIRELFITALIPFMYGILMEILQATLTVSRSGSIYDVFANSTGILCAILLWMVIKPLFLKKSDCK